jgi:S-adenosylmethionine hydrolase
VADGDGVFVGPDNGLLASAVAMAGGAQRAVVLNNPVYQLPAPGPTFAGRDVFGPVAAHLCNGVDLLELGDVVEPHTLLPGVLPLTRVEDDRLVGEVLWVDRFGNCQLNVDPDEIAVYGDAVLLRFRDQVRASKRAVTYGAIGRGEVGLVVDSYGLVSIALDRQSAATELGLTAGDEVTLEQGEDRRISVSSPVTLRLGGDGGMS